MSLAKQEALIPEAIPDRSPKSLIDLAVQQGANAEAIGKLWQIQKEWEANEARKAYIAAIQQFKANPPQINRTKHVVYPTTKGDVDYWHPQLHDVCEQISEALRAVGITHSWKTSDANGKTTVTCVLTHFLGHSEDAATLSGPPDTSGGKNNVQAIGSTVTYLQRYTLLAATGIAAKGMDNDGQTEGISSAGVDDYCASIRDASTLDDMTLKFATAWSIAKKADDQNAQLRFMEAKDDWKKRMKQQREGR